VTSSARFPKTSTSWSAGSLRPLHPSSRSTTSSSPACYVDDLSDDVIDVFAEHWPKKTSPLSLVLCYRLDAAYSRVPDDATAFSGGRSPRYAVFIIAGTPVPEMLPAEREWARAMSDAFAPLASDGVYVNAVTDFDGARNPVEAAYGAEKYARLAEIKAAYDPGNVFHGNASITPG
jgi:FAD/FMN-containing dehydrogenase